MRATCPTPHRILFLPQPHVRVGRGFFWPVAGLTAALLGTNADVDVGDAWPSDAISWVDLVGPCASVLFCCCALLSLLFPVFVSFLLLHSGSRTERTNADQVFFTSISLPISSLASSAPPTHSDHPRLRHPILTSTQQTEQTNEYADGRTVDPDASSIYATLSSSSNLPHPHQFIRTTPTHPPHMHLHLISPHHPHAYLSLGSSSPHISFPRVHLALRNFTGCGTW